MQKHLDKLKPVKPGDSFASVVTVERINAIQDALREIATGNWIKVSGGLRKSGAIGDIIITQSREDITPVGGGGSCKHWVPTRSEANLIFNDGVINEAIASNIGEPIAFNAASESMQFIVAECAASAGNISFTIVVDATQPGQVSDEEADTTPSSFKVLLGYIIAGRVQMVRFRNLVAVPVETRQSTSGEDVTRYFTWAVLDDDRVEFNTGYYLR